MKSDNRPANRLMNEINVVPYIDVMLVLLVIFMVTAPLMNPGQIDLPSVSQSRAPSLAPLEVIIKKDNTLALRDHAGGGQESRAAAGDQAQAEIGRTQRPDQPEDLLRAVGPGQGGLVDARRPGPQVLQLGED